MSVSCSLLGVAHTHTQQNTDCLPARGVEPIGGLAVYSFIVTVVSGNLPSRVDVARERALADDPTTTPSGLMPKPPVPWPALVPALGALNMVMV
jgi:hypothetical protein